MKKIMIALAFLAITFGSCKKEEFSKPNTNSKSKPNISSTAKYGAVVGVIPGIYYSIPYTKTFSCTGSEGTCAYIFRCYPIVHHASLTEYNPIVGEDSLDIITFTPDGPDSLTVGRLFQATEQNGDLIFSPEAPL